MPPTVATPQGSRPVAFPCPKCDGSLEVDGSSRVVACAYCSTSAYLPDDLWQILHPAPCARRWYLMYAQPTARAAPGASAASDPAEGPPRLEARKGAPAPERVLLRDEPLLIGRDSSCGLCLPTSLVSKRHAQIVRRDGAWWVEDLGSGNGTELNGQRIEAPQELRVGDLLGIAGEYCFVRLGEA